MKKSILIAGAGIAGLMSKYLLEKLDYDVILVEKSDTIRADGAGLLLAANVMRVFQEVGLEQEALQHAQIIDELITTDGEGERLDTIDFKSIRDSKRLASIAIHREQLHRLLYSKINQEQVLLGHKIVSVRRVGDQFEALFDNQNTLVCDHLIAADGVDSNIRKHLFGEIAFRQSHQACWRFVTDIPQELDPTKAYEMWGDQKRVGIFPIGDDKLYCYLVASMRGNESHLNNQEVFALFDDFGAQWLEVKKAIDIPNISLLYNELADIEKVTLQKDGVVLIGDAGHSTTPNLGQGAAMAIESAYTFYTLLKENEYTKAVIKYEKQRISKVKTIKERSMLIGKLAHVKTKFVQKLRNGIMRMIPSSLTQKEFEKLILND